MLLVFFEGRGVLRIRVRTEQFDRRAPAPGDLHEGSYRAVEVTNSRVVQVRVIRAQLLGDVVCGYWSCPMPMTCPVLATAPTRIERLGSKSAP